MATHFEILKDTKKKELFYKLFEVLQDLTPKDFTSRTDTYKNLIRLVQNLENKIAGLNEKLRTDKSYNEKYQIDLELEIIKFIWAWYLVMKNEYFYPNITQIFENDLIDLIEFLQDINIIIPNQPRINRSVHLPVRIQPDIAFSTQYWAVLDLSLYKLGDRNAHEMSLADKLRRHLINLL